MRYEKMRCRPPDRDKRQSEDVGSSIHSGHRSGSTSLPNAKVPDQKQGSSLSMSSSHRRLGQQGVLRSSSHRRLQTETYSSSSSRRASVERRRQQDNGVVVDGITAGDLHDRLAPSRPSLRGPADQMNSTRSLMERGSSRRELYERTSSQRLGTEIDSAYRDSLEDDKPLPSWTLNARPRPSEYVRSPPQTEHSSRRRSSSSSVCQPVEVEISPNVWMAFLRGANETWSTVANGFYALTMCLSCDSNLLVILDAEFVLCPSCRVVSPIMDDGSGF
jgi:hypothetical protein